MNSILLSIQSVDLNISYSKNLALSPSSFLMITSNELAGGGSAQSATDEVKDYLNNQKIDTGDKIDIPQELLDNAKDAEKEDKPSESD